jgi:signal transduction histidine kinase
MRLAAFLQSLRRFRHGLAAGMLACLLGVGEITLGAPEGQQSSAIPIRSITEGRTRSGQNVKVSGVITYIGPNANFFYVQDDTAGIRVTAQKDRSARDDLKIGAFVEIEGMVGSGRGPLTISGRRKDGLHIKVMGVAPLPEAKEVTIAQLSESQSQGVLVEVKGVVRSAQPEQAYGQETLLFKLSDGKSHVTAALVGWRPAAVQPGQLTASAVSVRGVFNPGGGERQQALAYRLCVADWKDITVERTARPAFERIARAIAKVRLGAEESERSDRLRIRGTVTATIQGRGAYVEDATGGMWVDLPQPPPLGEAVDVAGFVGLRDGSPALEDAVWRKGEQPTKIDPPSITAAEALSGRYDGRLVRIEALLLSESTTGDGPTLVLQNGEHVFLARYSHPKSRFFSPTANSWLKVAGICLNTRTPQVPGESSAPNQSFHLLLPERDAIEVASAPSWWTFRRIAIVVSVLAGLAVAAVAWATTLRRRVARQTEEIREHLAREAVAEERLRIARELHDSVQQDLLGLTMQIKATDRLLESDPEKARAALNLANAMVRRSQAETHRAVWDLREGSSENADLIPALRQIFAGLSTDESCQIEVIWTGRRRAFPVSIETHVLRIAQEAVTNALKHGAASRIDVEVDFAPEKLTLTVRDNGRGFDSAQPPAASSGHFGLFGMKERAIKLGAELRVESQPGRGTSIVLDVPLPRDIDANEILHTPSGLRFIPRPSAS